MVNGKVWNLPRRKIVVMLEGRQRAFISDRERERRREGKVLKVVSVLLVWSVEW